MLGVRKDSGHYFYAQCFIAKHSLDFEEHAPIPEDAWQAFDDLDVGLRIGTSR
jgi:hypothetical protein